ncbi:MAG: Fic family protein [Spirochaetota bacterium]
MIHNKSYIWQSSTWPKFSWDSSKLMHPLGECRFKQGALLARVNNLKINEELLLRSETLIEESIRTSAIEGENLNPDEIRSSVARRLGLSNAGLPRVPGKHIEGLIDILHDATINYNNQLTVERLCGWQSALFPSGYSGIHKITTGKFRNDKNGPMRIVTGPIGKEKIIYEAPPFNKINKEMEQFLKWFNSNNSSIDGIICAGIAHLWFVAIHPFEDGNGRLARAICEMALSKDEKKPVRYYSLSSQIMDERSDYYNALASATHGKGEITQWLVWFVKMISRAIDHSNLILDNITFKSRFWNIYEENNFNKRQKKLINKLLDAGANGFEGGITNRKYSGLNHVSRATAQRELAKLRDMGILIQNKEGGRSISYRLKFFDDE